MNKKLYLLTLLITPQPSQQLQASAASSSSSLNSAQNKTSQICRYHQAKPDQTILLGLKENADHKETDLRDDRRLKTLPDDVQKYIFSFLFNVPHQYLQQTIRSYCMTHKLSNQLIVKLNTSSFNYGYHGFFPLEKAVKSYNINNVKKLIGMGASPHNNSTLNSLSLLEITKKDAMKYGADLKNRKQDHELYKLLWEADNTKNKSEFQPLPTDKEMQTQYNRLRGSQWMVAAQFGGTFGTNS